MTINLVLAAGLFYSAIGALVMFLSHRALYRRASRIVAGHPRDLVALRTQQHDSRYGLILLVCGNLLQLFAAFGYAVSPHFWRYPIATLVCMMCLYGVWRLLARRGFSDVAAPVERTARSARRVFETRRSFVLLEAAIQEEANRKAREVAKGPRDRSVVYVGQEWECRWWSDKLGVSQAVLRSTVRRVGPMLADVERHLGIRGGPVYARAA